MSNWVLIHCIQADHINDFSKRQNLFCCLQPYDNLFPFQISTNQEHNEFCVLEYRLGYENSNWLINRLSIQSHLGGQHSQKINAKSGDTD